MKILVYAYRDWSFANIRPVLACFEYDRWWAEKGDTPDFSAYDLILTCEPCIEGWRQTYSLIHGRHKIMALQQGLWWSDKINSHAVWLFDKMMVWGTLTRDIYELYNLGDRVIVTGNPRFDQFFNTTTFDKDYTLVLGSGGERKFRYSRILDIEHPAKFQPHPDVCDYKMPEDTETLIRNATRVRFKCTGAGLIAMIMGKSCRIDRYIHQKSYMPSKLYDLCSYGHDPEYVVQAATGPGSTERVKKAIMEFVDE